MIGYPIVFRCCECTVEEPNLEHLESHIWSRHFRKFPFNCSICDYPAINAGSLIEHFMHHHPDQEIVEFRRKLEDEKRLRKMVADSIAVQIYDEESQDPLPTRSSEHDMHALAPMDIPQQQDIVIIPQEPSDYQQIVDGNQSDDEEFGLLEDEENVDELIEDDEGNFIDSLGNPVFMGAHDDSGGGHFVDNIDDVGEEIDRIGSGNHFHMKVLRQRRLEKTINSVASEGIGPSTSGNTIQETDSINNTGSINNTKNQSNRRERYPLSCEICGKRFKFLSKCEEHKRVHRGDRPFACEYCPARFTQKGTLTVHRRTHTGQTPYPCQWECGKSFISTSARRLHEKIHSGDRRYECNFCGRTFSKNSHCMRHVKNVHRTELMEMSHSDSQDIFQNVIHPHSEPIDDIQMANNDEEDAQLQTLLQDVVESVREEKFLSVANVNNRQVENPDCPSAFLS